MTTKYLIIKAIKLNLMKTGFVQMIFFAFMFSWSTLPGQNNALDFDGNGDYIRLSPIPLPLWPNNTDFTAEAWITAIPDPQLCTALGNFRRLFAFGTSSRFEVGSCGNGLAIYTTATLTPTVYIPAPSMFDGNWHCISVVRQGAVVTIYLDGIQVYTVNTLQALNTTSFTVGHWGGGATPGQDWWGRVDDVRLWNTALPPAQLTTCKHCGPTGLESNLVLYWPLDEGVPNGNNVSITQVNDASNNLGTLGTLFGFLRNGPLSNFVTSGAALVYPKYNNLSLTIEHPVTHTSLTEICSGDPVFVCLRDALGNVIPPGSPVSPVITWECSVNGGTPMPYTGFSSSQFCFSVPSLTASNCGAPSPGFENKVFQATLTVTDPNTGKLCTYKSSPYSLKICCPVPQPTVVLSVQPPTALNGTLCEGDTVVIDVSLSGLPAWFPATSGSVVTVDWFLNSVPIPLAAGLTQFSYPVTVGTQDLCFKVEIKNCACPPVTAQACIPVDPKPKCGTIIGCDPNLTLVGTSPILSYEICPGKDAKVCIDQPFTDCIPHWEFSFNNVTWVSLGNTNAVQNTNTLPCDDVGSPYQWPLGQQCIYYRIVCYPLSHPQPSGCDPCYSNVIKVCLKPTPITPIVNITGNNPICKTSSSLLSVNNPQAVTYTWYCNGVVVQSGLLTTYPATQQGWYWVEANNGCEIVESNHIFLTVCEVEAAITCPLYPNPCAKIGEEIHLSGCFSKSTCPGTLTYSWTASSGLPGVTSTATNLCDFYHIPDPIGTTYTLTVTWTNGTIVCTDTVSFFVKPCQ